MPPSQKRVANSAAILFSGEGSGRIIMFSDNPNFRGFWYGTNKMFLNALFFGSLVSLPGANFGQEEYQWNNWLASKTLTEADDDGVYDF